MKKLVYLFIALFVGAHGLYAQDCAKGYCPSTIVVHHIKGDLSAETKDITYNVVKIITTTSPTCWITQNLGSPNTPTAYTDYGTTYNGWQFQINRKQGYVVGTYTNAVTTLSAPSVGTLWESTQDPCTLTFGSAWRLPTTTEFTSLNNTTWALAGKLNSAPSTYYNGSGWSNNTAGGTYGYYWCRNSWDGVAANMTFGYAAYNAAGVSTFSNATSTQFCQGTLLSVRCLKLFTD